MRVTKVARTGAVGGTWYIDEVQPTDMPHIKALVYAFAFQAPPPMAFAAQGPAPHVYHDYNSNGYTAFFSRDARGSGTGLVVMRDDFVALTIVHCAAKTVASLHNLVARTAARAAELGHAYLAVPKALGATQRNWWRDEGFRLPLPPGMMARHSKPFVVIMTNQLRAQNLPGMKKVPVFDGIKPARARRAAIAEWNAAMDLDGDSIAERLQTSVFGR